MCLKKLKGCQCAGSLVNERDGTEEEAKMESQVWTTSHKPWRAMVRRLGGMESGL